MAEFCNKCAPKFGMRPDSAPLLCEGCGKHIEKKNNVVLWSVITILIVSFLLAPIFIH